MSWYEPADVGLATRSKLANLGYGARLFFRLLGTLFSSLKRFGLIRDQLFFLGNYSLAIIAVSGLFVGFVFGLQGYYTLQQFGSSDSLGLMVTLTLVRELGPVVTALLFAGRAGTSLTAEIGLMKAGEQISVMEMMAVDPVKRILAPRRLGRGRLDDWRRWRVILESDSEWGGCLAGCGQWCAHKCGVWIHRDFCGLVARV